MKFNDILRELLENNNLKQADLCKMTEIQTSLMSEYLSGKKSPTMKNAIKIADALNISLDTLVGKKEVIKENKKEKDLINRYNQLSKDAQQEINEFIEFKLKQNK